MQEASMNNKRTNSNNLMMTFIIHISLPEIKNFKIHFSDRFIMTYLPSLAILLEATYYWQRVAMEFG